MQQLQGGGASQVQAVEDHQQRLLGGQAAQEGGHGLERPPPLQLGRGALIALQGQEPAVAARAW